MKRKKIPDYLTKEEFEQFLTTIDKDGGKFAFRNRLITEMMFWNAMRVSEVVNLQEQDVHFEPPKIEIKNAKGGKDRTIPANMEVLSKLRHYLSEVKDKRAKYYRENPIFINAQGKKLTTRRIEQMVKRYAELSGIPKRITPHTFRHSFAVHWSKSSGDMKTLQQFLGHSYVSTTEIYLDHILSFEELEAAYANVK